MPEKSNEAPFDVLFWYVAVEPILPPDKSPGGIALPAQVMDAEKHLSVVAKVIKVGSMAFTAKTRMGFDYAAEPFKVKPGDYVLIGRYVGQDIRTKDGRLYKIVNDHEILMRTTQPERFAAYV